MFVLAVGLCVCCWFIVALACFVLFGCCRRVCFGTVCLCCFADFVFVGFYEFTLFVWFALCLNCALRFGLLQ